MCSFRSVWWNSVRYSFACAAGISPDSIIRFTNTSGPSTNGRSSTMMTPLALSRVIRWRISRCWSVRMCRNASSVGKMFATRSR